MRLAIVCCLAILLTGCAAPSFALPLGDSLTPIALTPGSDQPITCSTGAIGSPSDPVCPTPSFTATPTSTSTPTPTNTATPTATATATPIPPTPTTQVIGNTLQPRQAMEVACAGGSTPAVTSGTMASLPAVTVNCVPGNVTPIPTATSTATATFVPSPTAPPVITATPIPSPSGTALAYGQTIYAVINPGQMAATVEEVYSTGDVVDQTIPPQSSVVVHLSAINQIGRGSCPPGAGCTVAIKSTVPITATVVGYE